MDTSTYSIVSAGETHQDFELEHVLHAFAQMFKISPEKARGFVESPRTLKKDLDHPTAYKYKQQLEKIGLKVELKRHAAAVSQDALSLSIEPINEPVADKPTLALAIDDNDQFSNSDQILKDTKVAQNSRQIVCPKCLLEQEKGEQCVGCGVYMHKVQASQTERANNEDEYYANDDTHEEGSGLSLAAIVIAAVVALVGALIWKYIALEFGYEYGFVAWIIGGAVGGAVALTGANGQRTALACAIVTCLAIFGGKYMAINGMQTQLTESLTALGGFAEMSGVDEVVMRDLYLEELNDARIFSETVSNDQELKTFMIRQGYADSYESTNVGAEDVTLFKEFAQPRLEWINENSPSYEQWSNSYVSQIEDISTLDIMKEDFNFLDLIFLFLGMGTAFRLGRGQG
jgi:hypothetical protein